MIASLASEVQKKIGQVESSRIHEPLPPKSTLVDLYLYRDIPSTKIPVKDVDYNEDNIGIIKEDNIKEIEPKNDHERKSDTENKNEGVKDSDIKIDDRLKVTSHVIDSVVTVSKNGTATISETAHVIKTKEDFPETNTPMENRLRHIGIGEDLGMGDRVRAYVDHSHLKTRAGLVPKDIKSPNLYQDLNPDESV